MASGNKSIQSQIRDALRVGVMLLDHPGRYSSYTLADACGLHRKTIVKRFRVLDVCYGVWPRYDARRHTLTLPCSPGVARLMRRQHRVLDTL